MITFADDPDTDIVIRGNVLKVFIDLRGSDINQNTLQVKADKVGVYIFDKERKDVVKIVLLPKEVDPASLNLKEVNGTYIITLKTVQSN